MGLGLDMIYAAAAVVSSPVWAYRLARTGKWRTDWAARFGRCAAVAPAGEGHQPTLLIHAVSVGEVNAIRSLVQMLEAQTADAPGGAAAPGSDGGAPWRVVISATTDTGIARARQLFAPRHAVVRYPLDFTRPVRQFLDAVRPDLVALVELEVWPNFVAQCAGRGIPVCVINGRLSARSFKRYRLFAPLLRPTFARLAAAAVQTEDYAQRFRALGTRPERVRVLDTMKWDTAQLADPQTVPGRDELARALGIDRGRPLIVAGSTAPGEDKLLIDTCPPDAQLLLVPRKPEWFEPVAQLAPGIVRRSRHPDGSPPPIDPAHPQRLFLLDTMGELRKAYSLADVCLVGRSFLGLYGSDPIEPVALGKPTIIGPFHSDFADTIAALRAGGGIEVTDQPGPLAAALLADRTRAAQLAAAGRRVILSRQGATQRHAEWLCELVPMRGAERPCGPAAKR